MKITFPKTILTAAVAAVLGAAWAAASAPVPGQAGAESRRGLLVSYQEDHFKDMASLRYDRSPFYRRIDSNADTMTVSQPREWAGKRLVLGLDMPSEPSGRLAVSVNGTQLPATAVGNCQWDITDLAGNDGNFSLSLKGLGKRPRHLYVYATPKRVYVGSYTVSTQLKPTDGGKPVGLMNLDIILGGITRTQKDIALEYMLFDSNRHQVAAGRADASPRLSFKASIPNIKPWTTDDPERYMLAIILRDDRTGAHIQTVGCPLRFADMQTVESSGSPSLATLSGRPLTLKLATLDSVPSDRPARELLASQLHMGGANMVASPWVDPSWDDLCEAWGITAVNESALPVNTLDKGIRIDGSQQQWGRLVRGFAPMTVSLSDTVGLVIDVANKSDYRSLEDYLLDWEVVDMRGVTLAGTKGVVTSVEPGQSTLLSLSANSPMTPQHDELLLNLNWRRAADGARIADQQIEIASTKEARIHVPKLQKMKRNKNTYQAKRTTLKVDSDKGRVDLLDLGGWEVDITGLGTSTSRNNNATYDSKSKTITAGGIAYGIDHDGSLIIDPQGNTLRMTIPSDMAERIIYMGRGPGHTPASEPVNKAWISLNRTTPAIEHTETGSTKMHSDTRYLVASDGDGTPVFRLDSDRPFEFSASSPSPGHDVTLTVTGSAPLRILPLR